MGRMNESIRVISGEPNKSLADGVKTAGNPPKERREDMTARMRILMSAMQWFATRGFDGASVTRIASDAGFPQPLINYHFGNKLGLWQSVVDFLFKEWTAELDISSSSLKDLEPVDALKVTLRRHIEFVTRRPEIFMIAIVEGREDTERLRYLKESYITPMSRHFEGLIAAAQAKGQLKNLPVLNVLEAMIGATIIFFGESAAFRFSYTHSAADRNLTERHADVVLAVLFDGLMTKQSED